MHKYCFISVVIVFGLSAVIIGCDDDIGLSDDAPRGPATDAVIVSVKPFYANDQHVIDVTGGLQRVVIDVVTDSSHLAGKFFFSGVELTNVETTRVFMGSSPKSKTITGLVPIGVQSGKFTYVIGDTTITYDHVIPVPAGGQWRRISARPIYKFQYGIGFKAGDFYYAGLGGVPVPGGGYNDNNSLFKFDPSTETWSMATGGAVFPASSDFFVRSTDPFSFFIKGKTYVGGGYNISGLSKENSPSRELKAFDTQTERWILLGQIPEAVVVRNNPNRFFAGSFALNDKGYVVNYTSGAVYEYDPIGDGTWTEKNKFPVALPIRAHGGFTIDNKQYLAYSRGDAPLVELWQYDGATDTWTQKANYPGLPNTSNSSGVGIFNFVVDGKGYLGSRNYFYRYDPTADTWTRLAPYPAGADTPLVAFSFGKKAYVGLAGIMPGSAVYEENTLYGFDIP